MNIKSNRSYELHIEPIRKEIGEDRAAALLGLDREQLGHLSEQSGLGHKAGGGASERRMFTYQELHQLCRWVARLGLAA
jgi:hypothetical protein